MDPDARMIMFAIAIIWISRVFLRLSITSIFSEDNSG
jgi:hypothetical protein